MAEPDIAQSWMHVADKSFSCLGVGKVTKAVGDALLQDVGIWTGAEHVGIVISFEHYMCALTDGFAYVIGGTAYVGHEGEYGFPYPYGIAGIGFGIVGYGKRVDEEVAYLKRNAKCKVTTVLGFYLLANVFIFQYALVDGWGGINRYVELLGEGGCTLHMVAMVVGKEDGTDGVAFQSVVTKTFHHATDTDACINEDGIGKGAEVVAVATTATA